MTEPYEEIPQAESETGLDEKGHQDGPIGYRTHPSFAPVVPEVITSEGYRRSKIASRRVMAAIERALQESELEKEACNP